MFGLVWIAVGVFGLFISLRCLFASKETLARYAPYIGTKNPTTARVVCVGGFLAGLAALGCGASGLAHLFGWLR